jgi:dUTP pyrophosphatase
VKHGLDTLAGVVDPGYADEIKVVLQNHDCIQPFVVRPGYRIAQLILEKYEVGDVIDVTVPGMFGSGGALAPAPSLQACL